MRKKTITGQQTTTTPRGDRIGKAQAMTSGSDGTFSLRVSGLIQTRIVARECMMIASMASAIAHNSPFDIRSDSEYSSRLQTLVYKMNSATKLAEASFFLELLDALEKRKRPLTHGSDSAQEMSYLLGAIVNSLYSALEQAKPIAGIEAVKAYKAAHSALLGGKGMRNITIHEKHVGIDHSGYIPLPGNALNFCLRNTPRLVQEEQAFSKGVVLHMGANQYIEYEGKFTEVTELCFQQFHELRAFLASYGIVIQQGTQADSHTSGKA